MHGGFSSLSQMKEVEDVTLLNNSLLSEETLTDAKLQLIVLVDARMEKDKFSGPHNFVFDKSAFDQFIEELKKW